MSIKSLQKLLISSSRCRPPSLRSLIKHPQRQHQPQPLSRNTSSSSTTTPYSPEFWQSPSVIDVSPLADRIRDEVRNYAQQHSMKLVGILAANDNNNEEDGRQDAEVYSERIAETLQADSIDYQLWRCRRASPGLNNNNNMEQNIQDMIRQANQQDDVDGVLVFYPVYPTTHNKGPYKDNADSKNHRLTGVYYKTQDDQVRNVVDPTKDVEGLCGTTRWYHHHRSLPNKQQSKSSPSSPLVYPCTARSVQLILEHYHLASPSTTISSSCWKDQIVSIVNRSEIVGRPLAAMLAAAGATVYSIDADDSILRFHPASDNSRGRLHRCTITPARPNLLQDCLAESNVIVTGVPYADFEIPTEHIAEGATIVNVSEFTNINEASLLARPDIKYIPQVGKVTVAVLEQNLVRLHQKSLA